MPVIRILLLPFSLLYKLVADLRNHLYDIGSRKSFEFDRFVISVGNLTVGGTGKTPFVELLIRRLKDQYRLAILSRGYKRNTHGFRMANKNDNAQSIGDEPFQYFHKFSDDITVAVGEDRALAIPEILLQDDSIEVIIMDDAYQHRSVRPHLNILLNDYHRPFYSDYVMPAGLLRESRKHANRAEIVVVTKCPDNLSETEMEGIEGHIRKYTSEDVPIFFAGVKYMKPQRLYGDKDFSGTVYAFSGIANATPMMQYLENHYNLLASRKYPDHYSFTVKDLRQIATQFDELPGKDKCIVTTEKDMVRLIAMEEEAGFLMEYPVFYLPIELYFLRNGDFFAKYLEELIEKGVSKTRIN